MVTVMWLDLLSVMDATSLDVAIDATLRHYNDHAEDFWQGTKDHDVDQNYSALLRHLPSRSGLRILDFGCGPGRDLLYFRNAGHNAIGLDGCTTFAMMAKKYSGCPVWVQNFRELDLEPASFDGVFANASLFHVPATDLPRVLSELRHALVPGGILFSSNPRGSSEHFDGQRFGNYMEFADYATCLNNAGFEVLEHYYRPAGRPVYQQPWLAVVSQARA